MILEVIAVLPSQNIERDIAWYRETGHADTDADPLLGGSVVKFIVDDIQVIFDELVERKTVPADKLQRNTALHTHEIGFYDLNKNALFFIQDVEV